MCRFLKKLRIELPYDPVILLLGVYSKELKADRVSKRHVHPITLNFHSRFQSSRDSLGYREERGGWL